MRDHIRATRGPIGIARRSFDELRQDLRLALRVHARRPAFTLAAVAVLAIGIGATTSIFTGVDAILLRPLPFRAPDRLIVAWGEQPGAARPLVELSWPEARDWVRESRLLERAAAVPFATLGVTLTGAGDPALISAVPVGAELFRVLGVEPSLGRGFAPDEDRAESEKVIVLSHALWRERFGADSGAVGRVLRLDGEPYTVIGVMPPAFDLPRGTDAWTTLGAALPDAADDRRLGFLMLIARLRDGVELDAARDEMDAIARRVADAGPFPGSVEGAVVTPLAHHVLGAMRPASALLLAAAALVLVLATANVAGLLLARAASRRHEMAVRLSLGAGRARLVRQLLVESLVLGLAGGAAGVLLAAPVVDAIVLLAPDDLPRIGGAGVDVTALAVAASISLVAALAFGIVPAFRALPRRGTIALRSARTTTDERTHRALDVLIVAQVAIALTLLVGAGLLTRSVLALQRSELGFDPRDVIGAQLSLPDATYPELEQRRRFMDDLVTRVRAIPEVRSAAAVLVRPLEGPVGFNFPFLAEGQDSSAAGSNPLLVYQAVSPGYFETMRISLLAGRDFDARDREEGAGVVIVGASLAERVWPGESVIGRRLQLPNARRPQGEWLTVIGVVDDVRSRGLDRAGLDIYVPMAQSQFAPQFIVVRTHGNALGVVPSLRARLADLDPAVPLARIATMEQRKQSLLAAPRFGTVLLVTFAVAASMLATVGLHALLAHGVAERHREIGIRLALGALPEEVRALVLSRAATVVLAGMAVGSVPVWLGTRALSRFLFDVEAFDPLTMVAVAAVLGTTAVLAAWVPARRATRVDPAVTMRSE